MLKNIHDISTAKLYTLILALLALFFGFHADLLFTGQMRFVHDTFASYGYFYYPINCILNGTLPLWDPYTHCGQPFYYTFVKTLAGEINILFYAAIAYIFKPSFLLLYNYYCTFNYLVFVFGCFYFARVLFERRIVALFVFTVALYSSQYGSMLGQEGAQTPVEFLPWIMALFVVIASGKARSYHFFGFALAFIFYVQMMDFLISAYFFVLFCIIYFILCRKELALPKVPRWVWLLSIFLLCAGLTKTAVVANETKNIVPSFRMLSGTGKVGSGIDIASPSDQLAWASDSDFLNMLNPIIDLDSSGRGCELQFYIGMMTLFLALYALIRLRNRFVWVLAISGGLSLWVSLGPDAYLSALCFYILPLFKSVRVMMHFGLAPVFVCFVIMGGFGFNRLLELLEETESYRALWHEVRRYVWGFLAINLLVTTIYIFRRDYPEVLHELLALAYSYYLFPLLLAGLCFAGVMLKNNVWLRRLIAFLSTVAFSLAGVVLAEYHLRGVGRLGELLHTFVANMKLLFYGPFFVGFHDYLGVSNLLAGFFVILGSCLLFLLYSRNRQLSLIFPLLFLMVLSLDLVRTKGMHSYARQQVNDIAVPQENKAFTYKQFRQMAFWPEDVPPGTYIPTFHPTVRPFDVNPTFMRPAMLYMESSVITRPQEYDFYMLKKYWDAYINFPDSVKNYAMGITVSKLLFYTNYQVVDDKTLLANVPRMTEKDFQNRLFIAPEGKADLSGLSGGPRTGEPGAMKVEHFDNNRLKLLLRLPQPGLLYYSDGYDKRWQGYVDGKETPILRANLAFKALPLTAGLHEVEFVYRPTAYLVSLGLYLFASIMLSLLIVAGYIRCKGDDEKHPLP
jgi:hypothetical protein